MSAGRRSNCRRAIRASRQRNRPLRRALWPLSRRAWGRRRRDKGQCRRRNTHRSSRSAWRDWVDWTSLGQRPSVACRHSRCDRCLHQSRSNVGTSQRAPPPDGGPIRRRDVDPPSLGSIAHVCGNAWRGLQGIAARDHALSGRATQGHGGLERELRCRGAEMLCSVDAVDGRRQTGAGLRRVDPWSLGLGFHVRIGVVEQGPAR